MPPDEAVAYAERQLAAADAILARHHRAVGVCTCGRPSPCPIAVACVQRREQFAARLALLRMTVELPVMAASAAPVVSRAAVDGRRAGCRCRMSWLWRRRRVVCRHMARLSSIVIHCHDPYVMGPFWSLATGLPVDPDDAAKIAARSLSEGESVLLGARGDGLSTVWIAPSAQPRPHGRIHLDVSGDDGDRAALLAAGATIVRDLGRWTVMADPEGNEFCFFPAH